MARLKHGNFSRGMDTEKILGVDYLAEYLVFNQYFGTDNRNFFSLCPDTMLAVSSDTYMYTSI